MFRRVRQENLKRDGKPTLFAFELPDMSVNRERFGTAEEARSGFDQQQWGVAAFLVMDIPPRVAWTHLAQVYNLLPRHIPTNSNFAHTEVRVRRWVENELVLITHRTTADFDDGDPDRNAQSGLPGALLDPDFHMRWRKHIAKASTAVVLPMELPG
ncbi:MAG TPA: hypothetical protein VE988_24780 [Gemmataceae bacterium]|nr:hypothetical protein [Gemmataceae bacterium]